MTIQDIIDGSRNDIETFEGYVRIVDSSGVLYENSDGIEGGVVDGLLARELLSISSTIIRFDGVFEPDQSCIVFEIEDE